MACVLCIPSPMYKVLLENWVTQCSKVNDSLEVALIGNLKLEIRITMPSQCNILLSTGDSEIYNSI